MKLGRNFVKIPHLNGGNNMKKSRKTGLSLLLAATVLFTTVGMAVPSDAVLAGAEPTPTTEPTQTPELGNDGTTTKEGLDLGKSLSSQQDGVARDMVSILFYVRVQHDTIELGGSSEITMGLEASNGQDISFMLGLLPGIPATISSTISSKVINIDSVNFGASVNFPSDFIDSALVTPGTYTITVYADNAEINKEITIMANSTTTIVDDASGQTGQSVSLTAHIASDGSPVNEGEVAFTVNGVTAGAVSVSGGTATLNWTIPADWDSGTVEILAEYLGTAIYDPSSDTSTLTVTKAPPASISVTGVALDKPTLALAVGGSETLAATVLPSDATNQAITWSSDNTGVATVTDGVVMAIAPGTATITVKTADGSHTAACTVTVEENVYHFTTNLGTYTGQKQGLTGVIDASISAFTGLEVDGEALHGSNYSTNAGSTIITLHPSYLSTLDNGTYVVRAVFMDGYAEGSFTVNVQGDTNSAKTDTPATGDNGNLWLWPALIAASAAGACVLIWRKRRNAPSGQ